jgi:prepilin-type processing-associated H-X9-DG protein
MEGYGAAIAKSAFGCRIVGFQSDRANQPNTAGIIAATSIMQPRRLCCQPVEYPAETAVLVDKWDRTAGATPKAINDSWIEPFNRDFDYYPNWRRMKIAGDRHSEGLNTCFFDGHAKWMKGQSLGTSKTITGCSLVFAWPIADMCTKYNAGCGSIGVADTTDPNRPISDQNICNGFSYP